MPNPYSVLGIPENASEEEIKNAYRELLIRYGSDEYATDSLSGVANTKLQELNDAYDKIMAERRVGSAGGSSASRDTESSNNSSGYAEYKEPQSAGYCSHTPDIEVYNDIRSMINQGDITGAERKLMTIDNSNRGAEWNFLMGNVCRSKGWLDEAYRYFSNASSLDPNNNEYASAYDRMTRERNSGSPFGGYSSGGYPSSPCVGSSNNDPLGSVCQCLCLYSICQNCCCGGR